MIVKTNKQTRNQEPFLNQINSKQKAIPFLDNSATAPELGVSANDLPARRVNGPLPSTGNHTGANPPHSGFPGISPQLKQIPRVDESHLMTRYHQLIFFTLQLFFYLTREESQPSWIFWSTAYILKTLAQPLVSFDSTFLPVYWIRTTPKPNDAVEMNCPLMKSGLSFHGI